MCRLAMCIFVIAVFLNGSQIYAEENTTSIPDTTITSEKSTIAVSTETTKNTDSVTEAPQNDTTVTIDLDIKITTVNPENRNSTKDESDIYDEGRSKKTTRSVDNITVKPTTVSDGPGRAYKSEKEIQEAIEALMEEPMISYRLFGSTSNDTDSERRKPGYFGKLTGNLVMPALKARNTIGSGINRYHQGLKDVGYGTFQAASGAVGFLKDASKAFFISG